jgi:hypothetical protein
MQSIVWYYYMMTGVRRTDSDFRGLLDSLMGRDLVIGGKLLDLLMIGSVPTNVGRVAVGVFSSARRRDVEVLVADPNKNTLVAQQTTLLRYDRWAQSSPVITSEALIGDDIHAQGGLLESTVSGDRHKELTLVKDAILRVGRATSAYGLFQSPALEAGFLDIVASIPNLHPAVALAAEAVPRLVSPTR